MWQASTLLEPQEAPTNHTYSPLHLQTVPTETPEISASLVSHHVRTQLKASPAEPLI
jgi:hypothetical protein